MTHKQFQKKWISPLLCFVFLAVATVAFSAQEPPQTGEEMRRRVIREAGRILESGDISYVYGGSRLGPPQACGRCNLCLKEHKPRPKQRFAACPECKHCSLDCSHFVQLVFARVGIVFPYLTSKTMRDLSAANLRKRYQLIDLGDRLNLAQPGDLLVYDGHVVLLERLAQRPVGDFRWRGDILHATSGRELKGPGLGIQRQRMAALALFRGPLRRILRHAALVSTADRFRKLRPVANGLKAGP